MSFNCKCCVFWWYFSFATKNFWFLCWCGNRSAPQISKILATFAKSVSLIWSAPQMKFRFLKIKCKIFCLKICRLLKNSVVHIRLRFKVLVSEAFFSTLGNFPQKFWICSVFSVSLLKEMNLSRYFCSRFRIWTKWLRKSNSAFWRSFWRKSQGFLDKKKTEKREHDFRGFANQWPSDTPGRGLSSALHINIVRQSYEAIRRYHAKHRPFSKKSPSWRGDA